MKHIARILAVLLLSGIVCQLVYLPISKGLAKFNEHEGRRLAEVFEGNTPYNMLFLGSSRTHRSIYPKAIDSICGVNSFNAGVEAGTMPDFEITFKGYLQHHPAPKYLIITLDLPSFSHTGVIHYYPQYYPYLNNKAVYNILAGDGYHVFLMKVLPFLSITDLDDYTKSNSIKYLSTSHAETDIPKGDFDYKGFLSNTENQIVKPELEKTIKHMDILPGAVNALYKMIDTCKTKGVQIIFTYAPEYDFNLQKTRTNTDSVFGLIYNIANQNNIPFLRNDSLPLCKNPAFFANNGHLNKQGALVYSPILAQQLKSIIEKRKN